MKKIFATIFAASLMLIGTQANAQLVPGAGYLYASEQTGSSKAVDHHGFYFGASYNVPVAAGFGVAPGIYVNMLAYGDSAAKGSSLGSYYVSGSYLEFAVNVPVNLNYKYEFNRNVAVMAFAGPTFQVGLASQTTVSGEVNILGFKVNDGEK